MHIACLKREENIKMFLRTRHIISVLLKIYELLFMKTDNQHHYILVASFRKKKAHSFYGQYFLFNRLLRSIHVTFFL